MKNVPLPPIWLLILITGLPQISETIYTPSLPDIAHSLQVPDAWVEYTLTIYLASFALGTLFWGILSDRWGRRPCLLVSLVIYILGCVGCYFSDSISLLLLSRFVQGFGGSTGSVLGQAIARDAFRGVERGKVYSLVGSAISLTPAIGPFIGGIIDQYFGWSSIFLILMGAGGIVLLILCLKLEETHLTRGSSISLKNLARDLRRDKRVLGYGSLVGSCLGIWFSYYAEGSFYFIDLLELTPSTYGFSFLGLALAGVFGGWLSRRLHDHLSSQAILWKGILVQLSGASFFVAAIVISGFLSVPVFLSITFTIVSIMVMSVGTNMIIPNSLSLALEDYQHAVGSASSFFGFYYYSMISLFTLGMGLLHNGTLYPMPIYFFFISLFILTIYLKFVRKKERDNENYLHSTR
jgi:DHA1 family bicyclomycin/chloramphenicol resistance-like MFS transporter